MAWSPLARVCLHAVSNGLSIRPLLFCGKKFEKMRPHLKKMRFSARNVRPGLFSMCIALSVLEKMRFSARNVWPGIFSMFIALSDTFCVKIVLLYFGVYNSVSLLSRL